MSVTETRDRSSAAPGWALVLLALCAIPTAGQEITATSQPPMLVREFQAVVGVKITGTSNGKSYVAGTVFPVDWPEQKVELIDKDVVLCTVEERKMGDGGGAMIVRTRTLKIGQEARAIHRYKIRVEIPGAPANPADFPAEQPKPDRSLALYLRPSPGIESDDKEIRQMAEQLVQGKSTDWEKLQAFFEWTRDEVGYQQQRFTSAKHAFTTRQGDCEEKSALLVAYCRCVGVPARCVFTPGHAWVEFHLVDNQGTGRWLQADPTLNWFAYRKSPDAVLQKGDNFKIPEKKTAADRMFYHWYRGLPPDPKVEFIQVVQPVLTPSSGPAGQAR